MSEQHIFLVGPMGAGKSTIGKHLAAFLNRPFFDIDNEIESRTGADIQWIFDMEGEEGFRARETKVLQDLIENDASSVIATGGGIILRPENRAALSENGQVIYVCQSDFEPTGGCGDRGGQPQQLQQQPLARCIAKVRHTQLHGGPCRRVASGLV